MLRSEEEVLAGEVTFLKRETQELSCIFYPHECQLMACYTAKDLSQCCLEKSPPPPFVFFFFFQFWYLAMLPDVFMLLRQCKAAGKLPVNYLLKYIGSSIVLNVVLHTRKERNTEII